MRAARSVLAQTFVDFEIIVVDDGSRDRITKGEIADDPRVRIIRQDVNRGPGAARNAGVRAARGEVLAFLDSDDYWLPEKLQSQMAILEQQPDRSRVLIYSTYYYEKNGKWVPEPFEPLGKGEAVSDYLFVRLGEILTSTWLGSRTLFEQNPFCEELLRHQDGDLLLRLDAAGVPFVHCPTLAGVRTADLRPDRLSSAPVLAMRRLFLDRNAERITPRSSVLMEADLLSLAWPYDSLPQRHGRLVGHVLKSPRLTWMQKAELVFSYIKARLLFKIKERLLQQSPRSMEFSAAADSEKGEKTL